MTTFLIDENNKKRLTNEGIGGDPVFLIADQSGPLVTTTLSIGVPGKNYTRREYEQFLKEIREEALERLAAEREAERERERSARLDRWDAEDRQRAVDTKKTNDKLDRDLKWSRFETELAASNASANLDAVHRLHGHLADISLNLIGLSKIGPKRRAKETPPPSIKEDEYAKFGFSRADLARMEKEASITVPYDELMRLEKEALEAVAPYLHG